MPLSPKRILIILCAGVATVGRAADEGIEFFEKRVRPVLVEQCYKCHSAESEKIKGGLVLDTKEGWMKGGESGPALVPGKPEDSLLIKAVRRLDKDLAMPPKKELSVDQVDALVAWVKMGAPAPDAGKTTSTQGGKGAPAHTIDYESARKMWAYRKPEMPKLPEIKNPAFKTQSPIDRFVLAQLEAKGLEPAAPAEARTLIRRMTFDLTGLPPTPQEVEEFVVEASRDRQAAIGKAIDRLLASPAYGERWARHWLDVVRYTDCFDARGLGNDGVVRDSSEAWRYRDWVVNAFNRDMPYDRFIIDQVAGDILAESEWSADRIVATGVYAIGNWGGGDADKEKLLTDIANDQVDLTSRAFLGLTVGCARCHDHKFDPISTEDYYGLAGIFFSSHILPNPGPKTNGPDMLRVSLLPPAEQAKREAIKKRLGEIDAALKNALIPLTAEKRDVLGKPGLNGRSQPGIDNPSLTLNTTDAEISFITIKLPAKSVAVHPGPKVPVSVAWRSPVKGKVKARATARDVDPTCGDGFTCELRKGGAKISAQKINNGGQADFPETEIEVETGDLVQLVVGPRGEYSCDSTQIDFVISTADGAQTWDFRATMLDGNKQDVWWVCAGEGSKLNQDRDDMAALEVERKKLNDELAKKAPEAHALQEGGCPQSPQAGLHDVKVHIRGRYDRLGELVPRRFPLLLAGDQQSPIRDGSGRLALANWLASPNNPLTARVMVNRIWQQHFGEAIVRTPNNFGKLGVAPTHPELVDWLAIEFMRSGWSIKDLHRTIMLSATYQQSSMPQPATGKADPENKLFGHMNRHRLESEALRDSILTVSGQIDLTRGGPAIRDFLTTKRRTLYVMTVRSDRATYQSLFDAADPTAIVEKRIDSTVAPQALFLMNHPFVLAQTKALTERLQKEAPAETEGRIDWLFARLFARPATGQEKQIAAASIEKGGDNAWEQLCQVLLCTNEFVYID